MIGRGGNVLLFKGDSQYNAMRNYIEEIEVGFRLAGYNTYIIDGLEKSAIFQSEEMMHGIRIDIIFTCNAVSIEQLRAFFSKAYYVTYLTDHPAFHRERLDALDGRSVVFTCDRYHEAYIRRYFPNIKHVKYIPLSGQASKRQIPYQERSKDIVFTGSYNRPERIYEAILQCEEDLSEIVKYMAESMIKNPKQDLEMCLRQCLPHFNTTVSDQEFHELASKLEGVDAYARSYYRDKMIRSLVANGLQIHVFGNGWDEFEGEGKENLIIEKGNYYVAMKAVADSKISLNIMPWFKDGFQERIAAAMLSGAVAVTDESVYIRENFKDGEEMVCYSLDHLEELPAKIRWLLEHQEDTERIARTGKARAEKEMTWQHRAFEMIRHIQACASLFPVRKGQYGEILQIPYRTLHNRQMSLDAINNLYEIMDMISQVKQYDKIEFCDIEYFYTKFLFQFAKVNANFPELQISNVVYDSLMNVTAVQTDTAAELLNLECMHMLAIFLSRENQELRKEKDLLQSQIDSKKEDSGKLCVENAINVMRREKQTLLNRVSEEAILAGQRAVQEMEGIQGEELTAAISRIKAEIPHDLPYVAVWWYSVLTEMAKDVSAFHEFIRYIRINKAAFSENTQYFLWYQLMAQKFRYCVLDTKENTAELWQFYNEIIDAFAAKMTTPLTPVPREERDENFVLVITDQFLGITHAPSETALDRCAALIRQCGKKVLLINNAEMLSAVGEIPFYNAKDGIYPSEKQSETVQYWNGAEIPYLQCENHMPDVETIDKLLSQVRQMAPGHVVFIGKGGVLGNLAGRMFPSLAIGLCFSALEFTTAKYQALGRKLNAQDLEILQQAGYTKNHVIESVFTFGLRPQTEHVVREQVGLPDDAFVMAVIGMRLDHEVTDDFLETIDSILEQDMRLVFIGVFHDYEAKLDEFPRLKEQSVYLGRCNDVLSHLELCDLCLNPIRKGGGSSGIEALSKGVPVVTTDYGDVAVNVGEAFCVKDYEEMGRKILQYYEDKGFYQKMSDQAVRRSKTVLDTETEFVRIMQEMDRREREV